MAVFKYTSTCVQYKRDRLNRYSFQTFNLFFISTFMDVSYALNKFAINCKMPLIQINTLNS